MTERETIVAAAVRFETPKELAEQMWRGKPVYPSHITVTAPPPARHGNLLFPLHAVTGEDLTAIDDGQGFITSTGRFLGRRQAYYLAKDAGQKFLRGKDTIEGMLFSEDLW